MPWFFHQHWICSAIVVCVSYSEKNVKPWLVKLEYHYDKPDKDLVIGEIILANLINLKSLDWEIRLWGMEFWIIWFFQCTLTCYLIDCKSWCCKHWLLSFNWITRRSFCIYFLKHITYFGPGQHSWYSDLYMQDGLGIKPHWGGWDFLHPSRLTLRLTQPSVKWYWVFPGSTAASASHWPPIPFGALVKRRVELYLCSPSGPSWPILGWTLLYILLCSNSVYIKTHTSRQ